MYHSILSVLAVAALIPSCASFSAINAPSPTKKQVPMQMIFSAPFAEFKRSNLKKQLIAAAETKNEDLVISLVNELSELNPTDCPTQGLVGFNNNGSASSSAPLNGSWKLLFTNAKDAEAPARTEKDSDEKFGDAVSEGVEVTTGQTIDASKGECVNFIQLAGSKRPFDKLEITIQMTPLNSNRVRLDFLRGRAQNEGAPLPFLRDVTFNFPPAALYDFVATLRGQNPMEEPQAYFDVLYIDGDIRAHRTGEGKIFVQKRV